MKATELRIGNFVLTDRNNYSKTIVEIRLFTASVKYIRQDTKCEHQSMVDYERLLPIILTEEWLLAFGSKKINEYWFSFHSYGIIKHSTFIELYSCVKGDYICNSVKYVHQLQNLYLCLTNEELTIV